MLFPSLFLFLLLGSNRWLDPLGLYKTRRLAMLGLLFYLYFFPSAHFWPSAADLGYLVVLSSVCTIGVYLFQIQVLKVISAFTVSLSYNLEPLYSILPAMLFFGEGRRLNYAFYMGLALIGLSVGLQTREAARIARKSPIR